MTASAPDDTDGDNNNDAQRNGGAPLAAGFAAAPPPPPARSLTSARSANDPAGPVDITAAAIPFDQLVDELVLRLDVTVHVRRGNDPPSEDVGLTRHAETSWKAFLHERGGRVRLTDDAPLTLEPFYEVTVKRLGLEHASSGRGSVSFVGGGGLLPVGLLADDSIRHNGGSTTEGDTTRAVVDDYLALGHAWWDEQVHAVPDLQRRIQITLPSGVDASALTAALETTRGVLEIVTQDGGLSALLERGHLADLAHTLKSWREDGLALVITSWDGDRLGLGLRDA